MTENTIERKLKKSKKELEQIELESHTSQETKEESNHFLKMPNLPSPKPIPIPTSEEIRRIYNKSAENENYDYDADLDESPKKESIKRTFEINEEQLKQYLKKSEPKVQLSTTISEIPSDQSSQIQDSESIQDSEKIIKRSPKFGPVSEKDLKKVEEIHKKNVESFIEEEYKTLTDLEKEILEIARSILKKKKYSSEIKAGKVERCSELVQKLHEKCVAKLTYTKGYSPETIFETIKRLEQKQWIVTEHRRTKKEILESEPLVKVLEFIKHNPGIHARHQKIQEELSISRNPFIKHVMVLEAFGLIRSVKIGRTQNYFFSELPDIFDDLVVLFQNDLIVQIINLILEYPDISLTKIAERLNVYHGAIQYHIKTLRELNILEPEEKSLSNRFIINKHLLARYNKLYKIPPFNVD